MTKNGEKGCWNAKLVTVRVMVRRPRRPLFGLLSLLLLPLDAEARVAIRATRIAVKNFMVDAKSGLEDCKIASKSWEEPCLFLKQRKL